MIVVVQCFSCCATLVYVCGVVEHQRPAKPAAESPLQAQRFRVHLAIYLISLPCLLLFLCVWLLCVVLLLLCCSDFSLGVQLTRPAQDTGVIYGMTSACAAVVGSVGTYLAGVILDTTDSWSMVFQVRGLG